MNERQVSLFALFADDPHISRTSSWLAQHFGCSDRTVRSDLGHVNTWLADRGYQVRIVGERGRGFHIEQKESHVQRALEELAVSAPTNLSYIELFINGMTELLLTGNRHTIASLARHLYVSQSVLTRELRRWDSMLETYGLTLERKRWLHIEGPEERVRMFFVSHLFLLAPETTRRKIAPQIIGGRRDEIRHTLESIIPDTERLSRNALEQMVLMYALAIERVRLGHHMLPNPQRPLTANDEAARLAANEGLLGLEEEEHRFLAQCTAGATKLWAPDILDAYSLTNPESVPMADALCAELRRSGTMVPARFADYLAIIIDTALSRVASRVPVADLSGNSIRCQLPEAHASLMLTALNNPLWQENPLYPDDYTRVTMLLSEQLKTRMQNPVPRAALVVNTGIAGALFAQMRLGRLFSGRLELADVVTEWDIDKLDVERFDLLVSFDYLETEIDYVRISSLIDRSDIEKIERALADLETERLEACETRVIEWDRKLDAGNREQLVGQIFQRSVADGIWGGSVGEYRRAMTACLATRNGRLVAAIPSRLVRETALYRFGLRRPLFVRGVEVNGASVLFLRADEPVAQRAAALELLSR